MSSLREIAASFSFSGNYEVLTNLTKALDVIQDRLAELVDNKPIDLEVRASKIKEADAAIKDTTKSSTNLNSALKSVTAVAGHAAKAVVGIGVAALAAGAGLFYLVKRTSEQIHAMADQAVASGTTIENLQKLEYITSRAGVKTEDLKAAQDVLTNSLAQAGDPTSQLTKTYGELDIAMQDSQGNARDTSEVMNDLRMAYQTGDAEKQAKVQKILGGSFSKNIAFLKTTNAEYEELNSKASASGIITQEQVEASKRFNDTLNDLMRYLGYVGAVIVETVGPAFTVFIDLTREMMAAAAEFFGFVGSDNSVEDWAWQLEEYAILAYNAIVGFVNSSIQTYYKFRKFLRQAEGWYLQHKDIVDGIFLGLGAAVTFLAGVWLVQTAKIIAANIALIASNPLTWIVVGITAVVASIYYLWNNWKTVLGWMVSALKLLIPGFALIVDNWDSVVAAMKKGWSWIKGMFSDFKNLASGILDDAMESIDAFFRAFRDGWKTIKNLPGISLLLGDDPKGTVPPRAAQSGSSTSTTNMNSQTDVGGIVVNTQATDPQAVAQAVQVALKNSNKPARSGFRESRGR